MNAEGEGVFYAGRCAAVGGVCNLNESSPLASTVTCQTGRPSLPPPPQSFSFSFAASLTRALHSANQVEAWLMI